MTSNSCDQLRIRDYFDEEDGGWIVRHVKPKGASGSKLLHAGLMLFRTKRILRVVIFGGNLNMQPVIRTNVAEIIRTNVPEAWAASAR